MDKILRYNEWLKPKGNNLTRQRNNALKNGLIRCHQRGNITAMLRRKTILRLDSRNWLKSMTGYFVNNEDNN